MNDDKYNINFNSSISSDNEDVYKTITDKIPSVLKSGSFSSNQKKELFSKFSELYSVVNSSSYRAKSEDDFKIREEIISTHKILSTQFNNVLDNSIYSVNLKNGSSDFSSNFLVYDSINSATDLAKSLNLEDFQEKAERTIDVIFKKSIPKNNLPDYFLNFRKGSFEVQYFENGETKYSSLYDFERKFNSSNKESNKNFKLFKNSKDKSFFNSYKNFFGGLILGSLSLAYVGGMFGDNSLFKHDSIKQDYVAIASPKLDSLVSDSVFLNNYSDNYIKEISDDVKKDFDNKENKKQSTNVLSSISKNNSVIKKSSEQKPSSLEVLVSENISEIGSEISSEKGLENNLKNVPENEYGSDKSNTPNPSVVEKNKPKNVTTVMNSAELVYRALENEGKYISENSIYDEVRK